MTKEFEARLARHYDELKWLYCELYSEQYDSFEDLLETLKYYYKNRNTELKKSDRKREKDSEWYKRNDLHGMMFYVDAFAGNLKGVEEKLDYLSETGVNYLHLMPLLDTVDGKSDGGYAVSDFRKVKENLGTMEDLEELTHICHQKGMNICMDFVMNHTSDEHEWAKRARAGEKEYQDRYFFFDNFDVPAIFEHYCPQVFPTTAPGNFTWLPEIQKHVMTTFYPYQWDLNYRNPVVLNEMTANLLNLANRGVDIIRIDAVPYIWKELFTPCRNLKQVHTIVRMLRMITEIVCPGVLLLGEVVMEPAKVVPYFGTVDKPECHMLYNVTTMASIWHTVATRDVRLLRRQMDSVFALPREYTFLNYLRCHDDIGWGLDYDWMRQFGTDEVVHKRYLNDFFTGNVWDSFGRGELYNDDPRLGDARLCGTTASLCGVERYSFEKNQLLLDRSIQCDIMLHAFMLIQSGIPILYAGFEI
jgi:amylosucrase